MASFFDRWFSGRPKNTQNLPKNDTMLKYRRQIDGFQDSASNFKVPTSTKLPWEAHSFFTFFESDIDKVEWEIKKIKQLLLLDQEKEEWIAKTTHTKFYKKTYSKITVSELKDAIEKKLYKRLIILEIERKKLKKDHKFKEGFVQFLQGKASDKDYEKCHWVKNTENLRDRSLIEKFPGSVGVFVRSEDEIKNNTHYFLNELANSIPKNDQEAALFYKYIIKGIQPKFFYFSNTATTVEKKGDDTPKIDGNQNTKQEENDDDEIEEKDSEEEEEQQEQKAIILQEDQQQKEITSEEEEEKKEETEVTSEEKLPIQPVEAEQKTDEISEDIKSSLRVLDTYVEGAKKTEREDLFKLFMQQSQSELELAKQLSKNETELAALREYEKNNLSNLSFSSPMRIITPEKSPSPLKKLPEMDDIFANFPISVANDVITRKTPEQKTKYAKKMIAFAKTTPSKEDKKAIEEFEKELEKDPTGKKLKIPKLKDNLAYLSLFSAKKAVVTENKEELIEEMTNLSKNIEQQTPEVVSTPMGGKPKPKPKVTFENDVKNKEKLIKILEKTGQYGQNNQYNTLIWALEAQQKKGLIPLSDIKFVNEFFKTNDYETFKNFSINDAEEKRRKKVEEKLKKDDLKEKIAKEKKEQKYIEKTKKKVETAVSKGENTEKIVKKNYVPKTGTSPIFENLYKDQEDFKKKLYEHSKPDKPGFTYVKRSGINDNNEYQEKMLSRVYNYERKKTVKEKEQTEGEIKEYLNHIYVQLANDKITVDKDLNEFKFIASFLTALNTTSKNFELMKYKKELDKLIGELSKKKITLQIVG